ncbi:MAG: NmrA family NAD(P)-binding protein [Acidimicrobiales bacterium]
MIVVTAASGNLGRLVVDELVTLAGSDQVVAAARSTDKLADLAERGVEVRHLDYDEPASIEAALEGAEQVLLISSSEIGRRVAQHGAVIDAAVAAGVEHLAYTSILRADTSTLFAAGEHQATEELLAQAPLTTTRLRHGWYIENYTENLAPVLAHGAVIGSAGEGRIAAATRADLAAADAAVLADPAHRGGTFELGGASFSLAEYAALVAAATGREIPYVELPSAELRAALVGGGVPEPMADFLVDADLGIARGELDADSAELRSLAGRPLTTIADAVTTALA